MILVTFQDGTDDLISVTIKITGQIAWAYNYNGEGRQNIKRNGFGDFEETHALGFNQELKGDEEFWKFVLGNTGSDEQDYTIEVSYNQGGTTVQEQWQKSGKLKDPAIWQDGALLFFK